MKLSNWKLTHATALSRATTAVLRSCLRAAVCDLRNWCVPTCRTSAAAHSLPQSCELVNLNLPCMRICSGLRSIELVPLGGHHAVEAAAPPCSHRLAAVRPKDGSPARRRLLDATTAATAVAAGGRDGDARLRRLIPFDSIQRRVERLHARARGGALNRKGGCGWAERRVGRLSRCAQPAHKPAHKWRTARAQPGHKPGTGRLPATASAAKAGPFT